MEASRFYQVALLTELSELRPPFYSLEYLAHTLVGFAESITGLQLSAEQRISAIRELLAKRYQVVHGICR